MNKVIERGRGGAAPDPAPGRHVLTEAARYYFRRAREHEASAERALRAAATVHRQLSAAYRTAAAASMRGETVDFAGWHRAERDEEMPSHMTPALLAAE